MCGLKCCLRRQFHRHVFGYSLEAGTWLSSQDDRMAEVGRSPGDQLSCSVRTTMSRYLLSNSKGERLHNLPEWFCPVFSHYLSEKSVSSGSSVTSCLSVWPLSLVLSLGSWEEPWTLFFSTLSTDICVHQGLPTAFISPGWTISDLSAFPHRRDVLVHWSSERQALSRMSPLWWAA